MSHNHKSIRLDTREGAAGRQIQQDIPPEATSASTTSSTSAADHQQAHAAQSILDQEYDSITEMPDLVKMYPQEDDELLAKQRECLQLFYLTRNGNGATYGWYKDRVESRVKGTCSWFLQHELFQKWLLQASGPLLVSADPGCGKSVLAKYLIDEGLAEQSATICYFFFKDQDQNTSRQALCALLHQLFSQKSDLVQHAMELYNKWDASRVQFETLLWTILKDAVRDPQTGPIIFVVDALDECDESQLSSLMTNLKDIFGDQQPSNARFKVLMTSRPCERVVSEVYRSLQDDLPRIHIPGDDGEEEFDAISQDINTVMWHRVEQVAKTHRLSDTIKSSLRSAMLAIDHRTYLWVHLVFDYVDKRLINTEVGIDAVIQTLPKTVNEAYDRILNRSQEEGTVEAVKKALIIILAARRPLTLSEMNIAMSLDGLGRGKSIYDLDLENAVDFKARLRTLCGPLINVHDDSISFFHRTAREFLLQSSASSTASSDLQWQHSITTCHAHSVLAETCMLYLDRLNVTATRSICQGNHHGALLQYSVEHWIDHCREAEFEKGSAMVNLAAELCTPDLTSHSQWASIVSGRYHIRPESSTNVLIASHLGLAPVTELLLSRGADIDVKDTQGRTALMLAAEFGHDAVTRLLLENGADVQAKDDYGRPALMKAAESGHEAITRLLLDHGADVEARDNDGWTALSCAAIHGHEAVTRVLLENGANVETRDVSGWTALWHAAFLGHEAVTRLLVDHGADVEARDDDGGTALMYAAKSGHEAVTRLLLEEGADIDAEDFCLWTALMLAAKYGHEAVTRVLLENGADLKAWDDYGWTPFVIAAVFHHEAVIHLLLETGADVQGRNGDGWTALMHVAERDDDAMTQLLLETGADVDADDEEGRTALMIATEHGREGVARLLLNNGANVEASDNNGWTALFVAASFGQEAVARLLLENGANVEAKTENGSTPLMYATDSDHEARQEARQEARHEAVARLLLENGANVDAADDYGERSLLGAARHGNEPMLRLLLDYGAGVKALAADGMTALMHAAKFGFEAIARLLLENGADVDMGPADGRVPLILAVQFDHENVARLLLDHGANVEAHTSHASWTPLMYAAMNGHEAIARLLINHGANVLARDSRGRTPLRFALSYDRQDIKRLLLEYGAGVEAMDDSDREELLNVAEFVGGPEAARQLLLEIGETWDDEGSTA